MRSFVMTKRKPFLINLSDEYISYTIAATAGINTRNFVILITRRKISPSLFP